MNPDQQPSLRSGGTPTTIDPKEYPALAELQKHCRRKGPALIDRAYDDAVRMWQRLKEAEDLTGLSAPPPRPSPAVNRSRVVSSKLPTEPEDML